MIQISIEKVAELFAEKGGNLDDHPDLAAQIMALNEQLAATPGFNMEVMREMLSILLSTTSDAPLETDL